MASFEEYCARLPDLFAQLMDCPPYPMLARKQWAGIRAIYAFFDDGQPSHVGRTRNLQVRIRGHLASSHYSASYAFASARRKLGVKPTYRKGEGRGDMMKQPEFLAEFNRQRQRIAGMTVKFVAIDDPIVQHLFELYAAIQLRTSLDEFETS